MRRVAICQSNYIPWKGYFDLIHDVDVFLFYDDVQFTKNDWRNRNRIKTPAGLHWLSIPVGTDLNRLICDVTMEDARWQHSHWKTLAQFYGAAPFFKLYEGYLRGVYLDTRWRNLSALNQALIQTIARDVLGVKTEFLHSSDFACEGRKEDRVLSLIEAVKGEVYVSGPAGKSYLTPARFNERGIGLVWKDYAGYPEYPQFHPPFEHAVTILDLLFHAGPDAPYYIWGWRAGAPRPAAASLNG